MAREVKIGVSVIAVLLTTFAIVLFNRLKGSSDEAAAALAGTRTEASTGVSGQEIESASAESSTGSSATGVIEARPGLTAAAGEPSREGLSPWNAVPDQGDANDDMSSGPPLPALSYMPKEPSLSTADRQAAYSVEDSSIEDTVATAWQSGVPEANTTAAVEAPQTGGKTTSEASGRAPAANSTAVTPALGAPAEFERVAAEPAQLPSEDPVQLGAPPLRTSDAEATVQAETASQQPWIPADLPVQGSGGYAAVTQGAEPKALQQSAPQGGRPYSTFKAPEPPVAAAPSVYGGDYNAGAMATTVGLQAAQGPTPGLSADGKYIIQPNDNYWTISQRVYGTGAFFQALADHNRDVHRDETRLRLGETISVPAIEELEKLYPDSCPKPEHRQVAPRHKSVMHTAGHLAGSRTYVVQEGDTLFDIARHELGKASRYGQIIQLNQDVLGGQYDYLTPGMRLVLPDDSYGPPNQVTSRPGDGYKR
jgi:nucleoid-associated protein YgaU